MGFTVDGAPSVACLMCALGYEKDLVCSVYLDP